MTTHGRLLLAAALAAATYVAAADAARQNGAFQPGEVWLDEAGDPINAHGGGMLYDRGV
jgi:hypothetical protein